VVEIKLGLAWLHMIADEPAQAEHYLDVASALAPDSPQQYANRSEFLLWQGRLPEAIDTLQRRIQLDSGTVSDRFHLATALAQSGRYEEAVEQYRIVVERTPDFSAARYNLGGLLRRMGRHDEAVEQLGLARDLAPTDPQTRVELGLALVAAGRTENAIVELRRAIELAPDRPESRFYLEGLVQQLEAETRGGGDSFDDD
jgi:tetratricopeptide (TPR) repeat protein